MQKVDCILADSLIGVVRRRAIAAVTNKANYIGYINPNPTHTHLAALFPGLPGEPVPER